MAANIGQALGAIVKNNTSGAVRREARLPDPPALYPGGSDLGKALGGAVGNAGASAFGERVVGYAPQGSSIPPPPTLSLAEALAVKAAQFMVPEPAASRGGWNMDRIDDVRQLPPIPVSERARREQQRDDALPVTRIPRETATEEWGVYDVNGSMVAMPSVLADRNKLTTPIGVREPTSDPKLVANLKSSAYNYEKMQPAALAGLDLELPRIKRTPMMDAGDALGKNMREGVISTQGLAAPDTGDGEFMLLKHKEDGSVILRPRKNGEEALAGGMYNLVTGNVSREQVPGIMALPGMSDTGEIRDNAEVRDSTQTEAAVAARDYDHALANQRLREVASRADVVEIDGKAYPRGTTEPVPVLRTTGYDLYGKSGTTTDDIPVPPDGWAWVSDGKEAWLVQEQYDNRGVLITPRGTERIESRAEKRDTLLTNIEDMATDTFVTVLEKSINGAMKVSSAIVPQKLKSAWDTYIQEPMTIILMAKMPEGRLRNMLLTAIENPIAGALLFVNWGGDKNVDLITDSILYPGESRLADAARWQRHAPWVSGYVDFIEANEDEARRIYEDGWDADGDGIPEVAGGEAVAQWWHDTELVNAPGGSATWLMFLMLTDPLTWAAGVGGIGKGATSTLRAARLNATTPRAARLLHLAERGAGALTRTARVAEDVGDLGLRPLLEGIGKASSEGIPLPGGRRLRPLNPLVSSARKGEHVADAQSAIGNLMRQEGSAGGNTVGGLGTLEVDAQGNVVLRLHERNMTAAERQAGRKATPVDQTEIERIYDEAVGLQPGESIPTGRNSRAVKTEDGWRIETSDGQVVESQTLAGALGQEEQSLGRWDQRPLPPPGSELKPRYIDAMNKERLYRPVRDVLGGEWEESIRVHRLSDTPGTDVPNASHLNESDRMAWRTMEVTNSIDPTYTRSWERNIQGGDTLYQLSEIFRRTDYANAMRYWEAMTGKAASPVPLHFGQGFMSKRPIASLGKVASNVTDANSRSVMRANRALDNVYARLRWHPEDIYKPEFATIVEQAAKLDVNLRERGLRSSGPGWAFDPITTLIPDDAPVKLSRKVRASGAYRAPEFSQVHDAGDFVGRTTLDPEGDIHVDVHEIALQSVPEEWQASWIGNLPDGRDWVDSWYRADVNRAGVTELSTYGPTSELARKVAIDTATARDLVDADTVRGVAGVADITPVDYVARVADNVGDALHPLQDSIDRGIVEDVPTQTLAEPQAEAASASGTIPPEGQGLVDTGLIKSETTSNANALTPEQRLQRIRELLDEEGATTSPDMSLPTEQLGLPFHQIIANEGARIDRRTATDAWAAWGDGATSMTPSKPGLIEGETVKDPSGLIDMPAYEIPTGKTTPTGKAVTPGRKILDGINAMPDDSPKLKVMEARAGKATPATHKAGRSNATTAAPNNDFWLNRAISNEEISILTEHPFADGETLLDRITRYTKEAGDAEQWRNGADISSYMEDAIYRAWDEYEAHLIENVFPTGVLSDKAKARVADLPATVRWPLEKAAIGLRGIQKMYDAISSYYRQRILFNLPKIWHFPAVQYFGNQMLASVRGDLLVMGRMLDPRGALRDFRLIREGKPAKWLEANSIKTRTQVMHERMGTTPAMETRDILRGRGFGIEGDLLTGQKTIRKLPGGKWLENLAGSRFARDWGAAMDMMYRETIEYTETVRNMRQFYPDFRNAQVNRMMDWLGVDQLEARQLWKEFEDVLGTNWEFGYNDVVDHFAPILGNGNARVGRGRAERMGRDWKQVLNQNQKDVRGKIRHRAMAQGQTRADLVAQRLLAFHYFQSRQWWFMANQMASHPFMINLYFNAVEELNDLAERNNWPPYMRGFVKIMTGPGGRSYFLNPFALLSAYTFFNQENTFRYDQEGEHRNQVEKWIYDWTGLDIDLQDIGISPVIDKGMNVAGLSGDTWSPDLLHIGREAELFTLMINTARAYGLIGDDPRPIGNLNDDVNRNLREIVSRANPFADTVESRSSEQSMDREIRAIMVDMLQARGVDVETNEGRAMLALAEMDPDSELYRQALKQWIRGEWGEQAFRTVAGPLRPRTRLEASDGSDLMTNLAGKAKQAVNTPEPMVTLFRTQSDGYYELGDTRTRLSLGLWNDIANGDVRGDLTVNGITYTEAEIKAMNRDQRVAIANGLMAERNAMGRINTLRDDRSKFLAQPENKDFAQFVQWRGEVYDWPGGPEEYWQALIAHNPTAKAYYDTFIADAVDDVARNRAMTSQNAFFWIHGWDTYVFDKPLAGYESPAVVWDPAGVVNTGARPIPYEENNAEFKNEVRRLPVFVHEMEEWDKLTRDKKVKYGFDADTPFSSLPKATRTKIENELKAEGHTEPSPSWQIERYLEWVAKQPPGTPPEQLTIEAFFAADQEQYYESLPGATDTKVRTPKPIPGPDRYGNNPASSSTDQFWSELFDLLNEHDHNRYNDPWVRP